MVGGDKETHERVEKGSDQCEDSDDRQCKEKAEVVTPVLGGGVGDCEQVYVMSAHNNHVNEQREHLQMTRTTDSVTAMRSRR